MVAWHEVPGIGKKKEPAALGLCLGALNKQSSAFARKGLMRHGPVLLLRVSQHVMKTRKEPRECNCYLLFGTRRRRVFHWISPAQPAWRRYK
jgi:hypothetical protein